MAKFCSECGKAVDEAALFCSACGAALASGVAWLPFGASQDEPASMAPQVSSSPAMSSGPLVPMLLALIVAVVIGVVAVAHFSKDSETSGSRHIWPQEVVTNFENACIGGDSIGRTVYCSCVLVKLQTRYSAEEFASVESNYVTTGRLSADVLRVVADCSPG